MLVRYGKPAILLAVERLTASKATPLYSRQVRLATIGWNVRESPNAMAPPLPAGAILKSDSAPSSVRNGQDRREKRCAMGETDLPGENSSAKVGASSSDDTSHWGSGWAALAVSRRLALGATTPFSSGEQPGPRTDVRGPAVFWGRVLPIHERFA